MKITAKEISLLLGGTIEGNPDVWVDGPARIEEGRPGALSFFDDARYAEYAYSTKSSVLLVSQDFVPEKPISATLIRVPHVRTALTTLFEKFSEAQRNNASQERSSHAFIHTAAKVAEGVSVLPFAYVAEGANIGEGTHLGPQSFVGKDVLIGKNCWIGPGVKIYHACVLGNNVIVHANTVIGSDGFGFAPQADGSFKKIPQLGNVMIGDNVEIGANCAIDRAVMGSTVLQNGVKLDNLIQIAHNVNIGENTAIAAQAGIAGSTTIGAGCLIGGQAGFVGHIKIADGVKVQAQSGVNKSITEPNSAVYGSPALSYQDFLRAYSVFRNLPDLLKRVLSLEKKQ